jgi:hypothetical protein
MLTDVSEVRSASTIRAMSEIQQGFYFLNPQAEARLNVI